ncbi:hypothetical protein SSABA_v1c04020 [Spiroplasma sabaudiense Ar-1343]|uniref:Uncharacterized protein n=1 Tax=Spiroplasma sabaudiense Ar-1343 TaxID=1276257 RepID=W6AA00_9MOLU|nr:hypothetical protein [Spiroplasma sabaudiense]AHI53811.1 hypothetical protein SSABA_v1c04020 [Spiroplasma sabaudiense Ar-1343]
MENKLTISPGDYGGFKIKFSGNSIGALPKIEVAKERCLTLAKTYKVDRYYILDKESQIVEEIII